MISDARAALSQIFTPPFRRVLAKILALTLAVLVLVWVALDRFIIGSIAVPYPWLATMLSLLTGFGLFVGLAFLVAPISSLVAGFFLDEMAECVEAQCQRDRPSGLPPNSPPCRCW